ncbi:MAG: LysM peptidoglycan-binding domain-containing protein [Desulfobacteraceae bacterium]|nr:LysM peptidoglycan-binding domain-containing protein [Desulfobacteraceae bacterium]
MTTPGKLKKLTIEAYSSIKYSESERVGEFQVMFNPSTYSQKFEIQYNEDQAQGTSGSSLGFGKMKPQEYNFEFLFDGTGTAAPVIDVPATIKKFLDLTFHFNGELHRPNYLKISWGHLVSRCIMKSANVTYTLFKPGGEPLRAKIAAAFSEIKDDELRASEEERSSPDLTHYRTVSDGDTLPLMCYRIYGDMIHYLPVARYNKMENFRKLTTGTRIAFPPIGDLEKEKEDYA